MTVFITNTEQPALTSTGENWRLTEDAFRDVEITDISSRNGLDSPGLSVTPPSS